MVPLQGSCLKDKDTSFLVFFWISLIGDWVLVARAIWFVLSHRLVDQGVEWSCFEVVEVFDWWVECWVCWWEFVARSATWSRLVDMPAFFVPPTTLVFGLIVVVPTMLVVGLVVGVPTMLVVGLIIRNLLVCLVLFQGLFICLLLSFLQLCLVLSLCLCLLRLILGLSLSLCLLGCLCSLSSISNFCGLCILSGLIILSGLSCLGNFLFLQQSSGLGSLLRLLCLLCLLCS